MIDIEEELVRVKDDNARLRGALRRIDTGDFGSWGCDCPARDIARAALTATEPPKPFRVSAGNAPDDAPIDLSQLPQMTVDLHGNEAWIVEVYNAGYASGHHDTVETGYTDIMYQDRRGYHIEEVQELIDEIHVPTAPEVE